LLLGSSQFRTELKQNFKDSLAREQPNPLVGFLPVKMLKSAL